MLGGRPRIGAILASARTTLLVSAVALASAAGVVGVTAAASRRVTPMTPRGLFHGWVSQAEARVLIPARVCADADPLTSLRLVGEARSGSNGVSVRADLALEPPAVLATGAAIDRLVEVKVLDVGAGMAESLPPDGAPLPVYTSATARCRSFAERKWDLGSLSVSRVAASLAPEVGLSDPESPALSAFLVPEPHHTGVLALLLVTSYERPVEIVAMELGDTSARAVLAAAGWMEHWRTWEEEALAWRESGRPTAPEASAVSGAGDGEAHTAGHSPLSPTDPAPPLAWRPLDDLALRLEPYHVAVIVLGEWTFGAQVAASAGGPFARAWRGLRGLVSDRPEVVLTFPVLTYRVDGREVTVGMQEPLYADLR